MFDVKAVSDRLDGNDHRSHTRRAVKAGISSSQNRRRRNDTNISIRKNKRAEGIARRRAIVNFGSRIGENGGNGGASASAPTSTSSSHDNSVMNDVSVGLRLPSSLQKIFQNVTIPEEVVRLLMKSDNAPGKIHDYVTTPPKTTGATATATATTNDFESLVINCGCVPMMVSGLRGQGQVGSTHDEEEEVKGQIALCLGNIAGESPSLREYVLKCDAMKALLHNFAIEPSEIELKIESIDMDMDMNMDQGGNARASANANATGMNMNDSLVEKIVWSISNLCRGRTKSMIEELLIAIPYLFHLVQSGCSGDVQLNACWALAYMTDGSHERITQSLQDAGILHHIAFILNRDASAQVQKQHDNPSLVLSALRILCNYVHGIDTTWKSGNADEQSTCSNNILGFLDSFFTPHQVENISHLLQTSTKNVKEEACFLLSNIVEVGRDKYASIIVQSPTLMPILMDLVQNAHMSLKVEALWTVWNIIEVTSDEEVRGLVEQCGIISALFSHQMNMNFMDTKTILMVLDSIDTILLVGERLGQDYRCHVHECDGIDMIENLQNHASDDVYQRATEIMNAYFGGNGSDSDEYDYEEYYSTFQ